MALLNTVRAKLTTLVGLSAVATLAALPILNWVMSRQLEDVIDDRVPDALKGFDLELEDDVRDLEAATRSLGESEELYNALKKGDVAGANGELVVFHDSYPGIGLVALTPEGKPLAQLGLPSFDAREGIPGKDKLLAGAPEARVLRHHGCTAVKDPRPAFAIIRPVKDGGFVMGCMTLDETYLSNSAEKVGVELAISDEKGVPWVKTPGFPTGAVPQWKGGDDIVDDRDKKWAIRRFTPGIMKDQRAPYTLFAALDMTRVAQVLFHNLLLTMGVLVTAAAVSIALGARLASMMSRALSRVNAALKKLEQAEYVHVVPVKTGDEMEDLATGFNTMVDGLRERDKLRTTFGKYMTQTVMEHLLKGKVELGGETLPVTILFTDIRSFTTISEAMSAHDLVELLNEYFTDMVGIVIQEDGVVDKYIGDAIMAVFGAPVPKTDDAKRAVRAAVRMRAALVELNVRLEKKGKPVIKTGIGIHTGEVIAGNIGSEARMEYTVIGDAVNLASRLESNTKDLGVNVLISQQTHDLIGDEFETRPVKEITVKGKTKPVMTYEVVGFRPGREPAPPKKDSVKPTAAGA
jgi:adenylate cyclase